METEKRPPLRHDNAEFLRANFFRRRPLGGYRGKQTTHLGRLCQSRRMSQILLQVLRGLRGEKADSRKHDGLDARPPRRGGGRRPRHGGSCAPRIPDWWQNILPDCGPRQEGREEWNLKYTTNSSKNAETLVKNSSLSTYTFSCMKDISGIILARI